MKWILKLSNSKPKRALKVGAVLLIPVVSAMAIGIGLVINAANAYAASSTISTAILHEPSIVSWAFLSAAICTSFACVGAGVAVGYVGAAALGLVGERPEMLGRALIFVGLAEGIAIYGLLMAFYIVSRI